MVCGLVQSSSQIVKVLYLWPCTSIHVIRVQMFLESWADVSQKM